MPTLRPDPGSFRDPTSRVLRTDDGVVLRALSAEGLRSFEQLSATRFHQRGVQRGLIIASQRVELDPDQLAGLPGGPWVAAVAHPELPVWTYPTEWSFSMLRDAALLQLRLTRAALGEGMILKDATPYNVVFVGASPVFVDIGSFEPYEDGQPWAAYPQLVRMFLGPLLLQAVCDLDLQPFLRSLEGIAPGDLVKVLGGRGAEDDQVARHVYALAAALDRYADAEQTEDVEIDTSGITAESLRTNVIDDLIDLVASLDWDRPASEWSAYTERAHYDEDDLAAKAAFVDGVPGRYRLAWDVGANDGAFSRLAARHAEQVLALDVDHLVVDRLYQALRAEDGPPAVTPAVLDLADPTPALGFANRERTTMLERNRPDLILALAVVHHLAITAMVPIDRIVAWLAETGADVVLEVPTEHDPKVRSLLARKLDPASFGYRLEAFEVAIAERFTVRRRLVLAGGTRVLFDLAPRA